MAYICGNCIARLRLHQNLSLSNTARKRGYRTVSYLVSERWTGTLRPSSRRTNEYVSVGRGLRKQFSTSQGRSEPFRLAIIGSGPAGFYTASRVLKHHETAKIDMYERLPVPFGLVRYGVAPDHPEVKNCQDRFEEIAELPNFEFCGNIDVGGHVPLQIIKQNYDAILFAYGAAEDRELGIPGENLKGIWSARSFVAWYNGLPGFENLDFNLENESSATIIGQGNVSLDVARILLTPVDELRKTDISEYAIEALSRSNITSVEAIGRRGPLQAAFTIKEIRELTAINCVQFGSIDNIYFPNNLRSLPRARRRIAELLIKASQSESASNSGYSEIAKDRRFCLQFMQSPTSFRAQKDNPELLAGIVMQHQQFTTASDPFSSNATVEPIKDTPESQEEASHYTLTSSLCFRSIGYKSTPLPGLSDLGIQFDTKKGIIPNAGGRVIQTPSQPGLEFTQDLPGLYVAGWVKRGPTGVIASTMEDAFATGDCISEDISRGKPFLNGGITESKTGAGWEGVIQDLEMQGLNVRKTSWKDWKRIDTIEKERGARLGKEREKISSVNEMLRLLNQ